ncbi:HNH endonuclease signature motif containing protein [Halorubrum halophilum]|uniref:HNH endonuclease n=1 Tax=Halorubrum halophilum TaxID=413816 RepID=UPI00186B08B5|nr:HNH endonuclease signature motif containing protein [Halorubrum halophilum]
MNLPYTVGQRIKRAKIHNQFGGNPQCGISSSGQVDAVFLFTGDDGNNPYQDKWVSGTRFEYSGQGREGDQNFNRSNPNGRANDDLKNHAKYGKEVHLFEKSVDDDSVVVYLGQLEYVDHDFKQRDDVDGNSRQEIRFELQLLHSEPVVDEVATSDEETLRELAEASSEADSTSSGRSGQSYQTSELVHDYALSWADGYCQGCGEEAPFKTPDNDPYLEVHHVFRRADGGPDHPDTVIALCPNCHSKRHYGRNGDQFNRELIDKLRDRARRKLGDVPSILGEDTE